MSNSNPNRSGLVVHPVPIGWVEEEVDNAIHAWIKGQPWQPKPLTRPVAILRKKEVMRRTGLSYPTIWAREKKGLFPAKVQLAAAEVEET